MSALKLPRFRRPDGERSAPREPAHTKALTVPEDDHILVRVAQEHRTLTDRMDGPHGPATGEELDHLADLQREHEATLKSVPAKTLAGVRAKAAALQGLMAKDPSRGADGDDIDTLAWSLVEDFARLSEQSAPTDAAETIPMTSRDLTQEQPVFQSIENQLLRLSGLYEDLTLAYDRATRAEDAAADNIAKQHAELAYAHALRQRRTVLNWLSGLSAGTVREFGLKARVVTHAMADLWEDGDLDAGETACRALLDQLMAAAGVARIPSYDVDVDDLLKRGLKSCAVKYMP